MYIVRHVWDYAKEVNIQTYLYSNMQRGGSRRRLLGDGREGERVVVVSLYRVYFCIRSYHINKQIYDPWRGREESWKTARTVVGIKLMKMVFCFALQKRKWSWGWWKCCCCWGEKFWRSIFFAASGGRRIMRVITKINRTISIVRLDKIFSRARRRPEENIYFLSQI